MSKSPILFSSDDEDEGPNQEAEVLKKFQLMLQGVPPPLSVTMCKLSVDDMLKKYKENESLYSIQLNLSDSPRFGCKNSSTPLVYYANSSQISEDIANISQKVQSRYIYSETMSSCNIWFDSVVKINSAKKKSGRRNGFVLSPGSRLSHLARRRHIFSCENLQQLAKSDKRRHIEVKIQNALKTRTLERNKTVEAEKVNSFKRALFQSPDDEDPKTKSLTTSSIKRNLFPSSDKGKAPQDNGKTVGVSKQLFSQNHVEGSSKKRKRTESKDSSGNWPRRVLTFTEEDSDKNQETNLRNAKVISEVQLSLHHKSKLLWAVSVSLKEKNISPKDPQFKTCASALFMICRKNLGKILGSKREGGTSEKMLNFAREQIGGIFKKLGISNDRNSEQQNDVGTNNNSNEQTKENLNNSGETLCFNENSNSNSNSESSISLPSENLRVDEVQSNLIEKENESSVC